VRIIDFHGGGVLRERPLDLVGDARVHGDGVVALPEADHGEVAARELDAVVLVDEVEDRAGDPEEGLLGGLQWRGGGSGGGGILRE